MNLLEISDEFDNTKALPQEALEILKRREKMINYQLDNIRDVVQGLMSKIEGNVVHSGMNNENPNDPAQKAAIDEMLAKGYLALLKYRWGDEEKNLRVDCFLPNVPTNRALLPRIQNALKREAKLQMMRRELPAEVRRAKTRLSAWKRKQPDYVGRETGKETAKSLSEKLLKLLQETMGLPVRLQNQFYWKKNKMIVIEIQTDIPWPWSGDKPWEVMDKQVKPAVDKFLNDHGYTKVRLSSFYDRATRQNVLKLQIDDAEARDITKSEGDDETV